MKVAYSAKFAEFIQSEIKQRNMSVRQFAELVGVAHTTISRLIDPSHAILPTLELLNKLAKVTHTDIRDLVGLIYLDDADPDPEAEILATQISALPPEEREFIRTYLLGVSVRMAREESEK